MAAEGPGAPQPVQHLGTDLPVRRVGAQGTEGQGRRLKGRVQGRLRERLHFGKALRQRPEGEGLPLAAQRLGCFAHHRDRVVFQLIKNAHHDTSSICLGP